MTLVENLAKKFGEISQTTGKKANELVEVTKLSLNISSEEDKIQRAYKEIGEKIYKQYADGDTTDEALLEICQNIDASKHNIATYKDKIIEIKNIKLCVTCGSETQKSDQYCRKCGAKVD